MYRSTLHATKHFSKFENLQNVFTNAGKMAMTTSHQKAPSKLKKKQ